MNRFLNALMWFSRCEGVGNASISAQHALLIGHFPKLSPRDFSNMIFSKWDLETGKVERVPSSLTTSTVR